MSSDQSCPTGSRDSCEVLLHSFSAKAEQWLGSVEKIQGGFPCADQSSRRSAMLSFQASVHRSMGIDTQADRYSSRWKVDWIEIDFEIIKSIFRFKELYERFDVFFFTVQKFANYIEARHTDLSKFDLIIIDGRRCNRRIDFERKYLSFFLVVECHHCYDNHPINSMMRQYHRSKASGISVPQIIGLYRWS